MMRVKSLINTFAPAGSASGQRSASIPRSAPSNPENVGGKAGHKTAGKQALQ